MFDTHCHLQTDAFDSDREEVLTSSRNAGVKGFLVPAIDRSSFDRTLEIARSHPDVVCALGIHPHSASEWSGEVRDTIREQLGKNTKIRAIGEIGLDYYYDFAPKDVQRTAFAEQIELAKEQDLPIVIHTRDSEEDVYRIVEEHYGNPDDGKAKGQFHCFSGDVALMERAIALGFYVSFTGNITFKKSELGEVVRQVPLERVLLETDSPYLTPMPYRGKRNTPQYLRLIAEKIAEIKGIDIHVVMDQTHQNALRLFRITLWMIALLFGSSFLTPDAAEAQPRNPVGSRPPDSVMTPERRQAEELLRKQREELEREQAQRRQDSIRQLQIDQERIRQEAILQARRDSAEAAERLADAEAERLRLLTPMPWKAIGAGAGAGIGNMAMTQSKGTITPTSVLATSLQLGGHVTRTMDFEFSYSQMRVGSNLLADSLYNVGPDAPTAQRARGQALNPGSRVPTNEDLDMAWLSLDARWVINPRAPFKFYAGVGYSQITMNNRQEYQPVSDTTLQFVYDQSKVEIFEQSFSRGAIKVLFGIRYDLELNSQFTLTPFAQIGTLFAFQGDEQRLSFVFQPDREQITMTQLNIGATLYFGWFGVPRNPEE